MQLHIDKRKLHFAICVSSAACDNNNEITIISVFFASIAFSLNVCFSFEDLVKYMEKKKKEAFV